MDLEGRKEGRMDGRKEGRKEGVSCIGFRLGEEWENGCRWRWVGRGRGRRRGRPPTFNVEETVHRHDRAQEDGDAFWLLGEGGKEA